MRYLPIRHDYGFAVLDTATAQRCYKTDTPHEADATRWADALNTAYSGFLRAKETVRCERP